MLEISSSVPATHLSAHGRRETMQAVAEETPVALRYNGFPHAVMMATPADLHDFVIGFSLTEGLIQSASDIRSLSITSSADGLIAETELAPASLHRFLAGRRLRQLAGRTSCGLCGVTDLTDIARDHRAVPRSLPPRPEAIQRAVASLRNLQPLARGTRAAHASAWVNPEGYIVTLREDVGRHNSLDKLIGANLRGTFSADVGFCLITSRCSFEMVQKAIAAGFSTLVSVSAPTAYAVRTARVAGLNLISLSREGGQFFYGGRSNREDNEDVAETPNYS
jgi:FdhD protein